MVLEDWRIRNIECEENCLLWMFLHGEAFVEMFFILRLINDKSYETVEEEH